MYAEQASGHLADANFYFFQGYIRQLLHRIGGAERDRTADPLLAKQVLSQLSYSPTSRWVCQIQPIDGGPGQTRTADLTLIRRAL
jgi:hypothetical protein